MTRKPTVTSLRPQVNEDAVEELERALDRARSGEITDVVICGRLRGGSHHIAYACDDVYIMTGMLENLKFRLLSAVETVKSDE